MLDSKNLAIIGSIIIIVILSRLFWPIKENLFSKKHYKYYFVSKRSVDFKEQNFQLGSSEFEIVRRYTIIKFKWETDVPTNLHQICGWIPTRNENSKSGIYFQVKDRCLTGSPLMYYDKFVPGLEVWAILIRSAVSTNHRNDIIIFLIV